MLKAAPDGGCRPEALLLLMAGRMQALGEAPGSSAERGRCWRCGHTVQLLQRGTGLGGHGQLLRRQPCCACCRRPCGALRQLQALLQLSELQPLLLHLP